MGTDCELLNFPTADEMLSLGCWSVLGVRSGLVPMGRGSQRLPCTAVGARPHPSADPSPHSPRMLLPPSVPAWLAPLSSSSLVLAFL